MGSSHSCNRNIFLFRKGEPFTGCAFFTDLNLALSYRDCSAICQYAGSQQDEPSGSFSFEPIKGEESELMDLAFDEDKGEFYPANNGISIYGLAIPEAVFKEIFRENGIGYVVREMHRARGIEAKAENLGAEEETRQTLARKGGLIKIIDFLRRTAIPQSQFQ